MQDVACIVSVSKVTTSNARAVGRGKKSKVECEAKQEEGPGGGLSTEINFRDGAPYVHSPADGENFSADLINTRTGPFFDATDLITFLRRLVNHLAEATEQPPRPSFLPSHRE